jgi:Flp pilus assembly protein TadD
MSLLNDALRKKTGENNIKEAGYTEQRHFAQGKVNGAKFSRVFVLPLLLGSLVFGAWYFWGSLSAQTDSPITASIVEKDIEENEFDDFSDPDEIDKQEVKPGFDMPRPIGEISPLKEAVEIDTKENAAPPAKRPEKTSPPAPKKVAKKPRSVKKTSAQKTSVQKVPSQKALKVKEKVVPSQQETLFLQKALHYHRQGKFNQAIQMYQQVLKVKPYHRNALFNLASAYIHLTAYSEAYPLLKKLRSFNPGNPDVLINLAIVEIGSGKSADALQLLDLAAKRYKEPKFEICFHQAAALSRIGRLEEALSSYKTAEELNGQHPILNFNMAVIYDKLHQYDNAVNYYRAFLKHRVNLPQNEEKKIESRIRSLRVYLAESRNS